MIKTKIVLGLFILLAFAQQTIAQQDPTYTQYNFNTQTINPAYAGSWESLGFMVLGRNQWVGIKGAPETITFSIQSPTRNENVGLGFNIISDKLGRESKFGISGDYSYRLQLKRGRTYLRLGLKAGMTNYTNNLSQYAQYASSSSDDPINQIDIDGKYLLNFGFGAFLYSERFYLGLSVPKLLENKYISDYTNYSSIAEIRHFYLQGGYAWDLSEDIKFKPTFLARVTSGSPASFDLTANFIFKDKVSLGAMHRFGDSFGFIGQWLFDKKLRIGYSIDFTISELQHYSGGTHEVMVSYELGYRTRWTSPRMF